MPEIRFTAKLVRSEGWLCLNLPKAASKKLGSRARVPVAGKINGFPIRTSAFPVAGETHMILVNKDMQRGADAGEGDTVAVILSVDTKPRIVKVPPDLRKALEESPAAEAAFEELSYSHRREYARWIEDAKKDETRARRIEKAVAMLSRRTKTP